MINCNNHQWTKGHGEADSGENPRCGKEHRDLSARRVILDGAVDCIFKYGFAAISTPAVAREADMSNGDIVHCFPTRHSLLLALVKHLHQLRICQYVDLMRGIDESKKEMTLDQQCSGIGAAWAHINLPSLVAYQELLAASRTDDELSAVMAPLELKFDREFMATAQEIFPHWTSPGALRLAIDLVQFTLTGMALSYLQGEEAPRRERLLSMLAEVIDGIYRSTSSAGAKSQTQ